MLYKMDAPNEFFIELVGISIPDLEKLFASKRTYYRTSEEVYKIVYNFDSHRVIDVRFVNYDDTENTYIINAFDRNAFANCPYEDERQEGIVSHDSFVGRIITQFGNASVSMECDYLKECLGRMPQNSLKRNAALVI